MIRHIRTIHPFPARMAPEIAIAELSQLCSGQVVLDPMAGSGTVLRHASEMGLKAIGVDIDPLAVLISRVWTTRFSRKLVEDMARLVMLRAQSSEIDATSLPWLAGDTESIKFISYWFGCEQRRELAKLASTIWSAANELQCPDEQAALDVLRVALSRIIITKSSGASLARDVSHSRPHRVCLSREYSVVGGFTSSLERLCRLLDNSTLRGNVSVALGDARNLNCVQDGEVDICVTSPPYLNAIDYMRGHKMALVWLGYRLCELRAIRSCSIGAERAPELGTESTECSRIVEIMGKVAELPQRYRAILLRYASDLLRMTSELARVIKPGGRAVLVVGDSVLRGIFLSNSNAVVLASEIAGMELEGSCVRELPAQKRYLPMPDLGDGSLSKRMRSEVVVKLKRRG